MERGPEQDDNRESTPEREGAEEEPKEQEREDGEEERSGQGSEGGEEERSDRDRRGRKGELTEEEEKEQRAEDARQAQERLEEVRDAPPEEHADLQADALGSTIILIGALFIVFGVVVALAFSPWGWLGAAVGVGEVIVGQLIRTGALRRGGGE